MKRFALWMMMAASLFAGTVVMSGCDDDVDDVDDIEDVVDE